MGRNAKASAGYSMPRAARKTKGVQVMLSPEDLAAADALALSWGCSRSAAVVRLIRAAADSGLH